MQGGRECKQPAGECVYGTIHHNHFACVNHHGTIMVAAAQAFIRTPIRPEIRAPLPLHARPRAPGMSKD